MDLMVTKSQLESELKDAMRANDDVRKRTLRMVLTALKLAEVEKGEALDEKGIFAVLQKEIKSRQESVAEAQHAKRPELEASTMAEIVVLESYLPKQLSPEELEALARQVIAETGASSAREIGLVMKALVPRLEGRATGDQASQVVRKILG